MTRELLTLRFSRPIMREVLSYSLPLMPAAVSTWALHSADKSLVGFLVGVEQAAIYGVGYKIGLLVAIGTAPFNAAWAPFAFSIMHRKNAANVYRHVLTAVATLYFFLVLVVTFFKEELMQFLAPESYQEAAVVVVWVALGQAVWGLYPVLSIGPKIAKRTNHIAYVTGAAALVNIALNVTLLPRIGILGAAIATLVSYVVVSAAVYFVGRYSYSFPLDVSRLGRLVLAGIVVLLIESATVELIAIDLISLLVRCLLLLLYPVLIVGLRVLSWKDLRTLYSQGRTVLTNKRLEKQPI